MSAPTPGILALAAPLAGWSAPLDEAPDEVFASRMLGDGVAIDPTEGVLYAPCDGELVAVAAARHAVTLRTANGCQILMHVGLETVALAGAGFEIRAPQGARVRTGDVLLSFVFGVLLSGIIYSAANGIWPSLYGEMFSTRVRLSGMAIGTQIGFALGGFAPTISAAIS